MIDTYTLAAISSKPSSWHPIDWSEPAQQAALEPYLDFSNKESYIAWRTEWRVAYREISQRIRTLREEWRAEGSDHDFRRTRNLLSYRALARAMLALRRASKIRAEEMYQQAKEASAVA